MKRFFFILLSISASLLSMGQSQRDKKQNTPLVIGEVDELQSAILSEKRTLNIYLPDGYNPKDTVTYPVVYLLDGGMDEDFLHISGLYQFNSFPWINIVSPSIVVGIVNKDRRRDMTYPTRDTGALRRYPESGHSDRFISFLEKEVQPYIRQKFKTASSSTIIGESLGGLLVTEILLKKPSMFTTYIIVSPSLWWDNGSLLEQSTALLKSVSEKIEIYIGVGKEGVAPGNPPRVMEVDANLLADKIRSVQNKNLDVSFDYLPQENHATIMHQAMMNALRMLKK